MNLNKPQLTYVNSVPAFNKILHDATKNVRYFFFTSNLLQLLVIPFYSTILFFQVKDVYFPTSETAALCWESTDNFTPQDASTNVFIAAFTTAWARIKLYSEMDKLGQAVLYHDTDSIIYASNGENDPPLGNFLGEFTDELEGDTITTFVSGNYIFYIF